MKYNLSKSKADSRLVHLFTGKELHSFPLYDRTCANAGYDFLADCIKDGCPILCTNQNVYIWVREGGWR